MSKTKYLIALSIAAAMSVPALAKADSVRCELLTYKPTQVAPVYVTLHAGRGGGTQYLKGAQLFVPAQPGLTAEWLRLDLERHISAMKQQPMPGCPLANTGVSLAVVSGGTGFWVQVTTNDSDVAKILMQEAEQLVSPGSNHR